MNENGSAGLAGPSQSAAHSGRGQCFENMETPAGLRRLTDRSPDRSGDRSFLGFAPDESNMKKVIEMERELRSLREIMKEVWENQELIYRENKALKEINADTTKEINELKKELNDLKMENETLKSKVNLCETGLKEINTRVNNIPEKKGGNINEDQLQKLRNDWKKEHEKQKVSFKEIMDQQVKDKTKETVIQVIKEKDNLVRDAVDKKKCIVIFGVQEKKNPVKFVRERENKEIARNIIKRVQDDEQELEKEIEEVYRIGKYNEGNHRPLKVKLKSQATAEEVLARTGKLANIEECKNIWIKRDMNLEEREKEKMLKNEAKEKNEKRTEIEKKKFFWRVLDMRIRKWYIQEKKEEKMEPEGAVVNI